MVQKSRRRLISRLWKDSPSSDVDQKVCNLFHSQWVGRKAGVELSYDVQAAVDVNRVAGHPRGTAADKEGHDTTNFCDIDESMLRTAGNSGRNEFVELSDAARRAGLQWPRRHRVNAYAFFAEL